MWEVIELVMEGVQRVCEQLFYSCYGGALEDGFRAEEENVMLKLLLSKRNAVGRGAAWTWFVHIC